jgi:prepilin-type N-terminal cleavage/methylation domain-containing protein
MRTARPLRKGFTLVELLAVITVSSFVLGLCVATVYALMRMEQAGRARLAEGASLGRLSLTFRDDVRAATGARPSAGDDRNPARLELALPEGRTVEYQARRGELLRTERSGGKVDHMDRFRLTAGASPRFATREEDGRTVVGVDVGSPIGEPRVSARRGLRVEAVLGLGRRFESKEGGS